jgi:hypothetical protein
MWRIGRVPNSIPIYSYIQKDATLHILFISGNCCTCFGWYFHPLSGAHTTVSTCHTVTAICRYRGRVGTGLSVLWVAYANHSTQMGINSAFKGVNVITGGTCSYYCTFLYFDVWKNVHVEGLFKRGILK